MATSHGGFVSLFPDSEGRSVRVEAVLGFGLVCTFDDECGRALRVYLVGDEKERAKLAGYEYEDGVEFRRADVEDRIREVLDSLHAAGQKPVVKWCGIDPGAALRTNRGPQASWSVDELDQLVARVIERQAAGLSPTDFRDGERWRLEQRTVRELLKDGAEPLGLVEIERRAGHRNRYRRPDGYEGPTDAPRPSFDAQRCASFELAHKQRELQANWERQRSRPLRARPVRQLAEFEDHLASDGDVRCDARVGDPRHVGAGLRCSLKAGHNGDHAALFRSAMPASNAISNP